MTPTDEELVIEYKNGSQEALRTIVERYSGQIFGFVRRLGVSKSDAQDVVQEVFIKVWKGIGKFDTEKASFKTRLFRIARNTVIDYLLKKKSIVFSELADQEDEPFENTIVSEDDFAEVLLDKAQDVKLLNDALSKLPVAYQEVLALHYQEEMTFEEIGQVLDKSINTVKSQHRRALIELRKILL